MAYTATSSVHTKPTRCRVTPWGSDEAARLSTHTWLPSGSTTAHCAGADGKSACDWISRSVDAVCDEFVDLCIRTAATRTRMDRGSFDRDRVPVGRWQK